MKASVEVLWEIGNREWATAYREAERTKRKAEYYKKQTGQESRAFAVQLRSHMGMRDGWSAILDAIEDYKQAGLDAFPWTEIHEQGFTELVKLRLQQWHDTTTKECRSVAEELRSRE